MGTTSATFKQLGNTPDLKHILKSLLSIGAKITLLNLRNFVSTSLDLVAFLAERESIMFIISLVVDGAKKIELFIFVLVNDFVYDMPSRSAEDIDFAILGPILTKCSFKLSAIWTHL